MTLIDQLETEEVKQVKYVHSDLMVIVDWNCFLKFRYQEWLASAAEMEAPLKKVATREAVYMPSLSADYSCHQKKFSRSLSTLYD